MQNSGRLIVVYRVLNRKFGQRILNVAAGKSKVSLIMNHDSGFIIGIAVEFLKILIEQSPKTSLRKQTRA